MKSSRHNHQSYGMNGIDVSYSDSVEQIVVIILSLLEDPNILENLWFDLHSIVIPDRIFTKEIEDDKIRCFKSNVFTPQRTAANCIRFVFTFFVTRSKSEFVNEIHGSSTLPIGHHLWLEVGLVVLPDTVDVVLMNEWESTKCLTKQRKFATFNSLAFSNFCMSLWPFHTLPAARKTYLWLLFTFSVHVANHVTVLSYWIAFQFPGMLGMGISASLPMLMVISSGRTRNLGR